MYYEDKHFEYKNAPVSTHFPSQIISKLLQQMYCCSLTLLSLRKIIKT